MVKYSMNITESAENDLKSIVEYIGIRLKEPSVAMGIYRNLKKTILSLEEMPTRINLVSDKYLANKGYRKAATENYYIFFIVNEQKSTVEIVRILNCRRNWIEIIK